VAIASKKPMFGKIRTVYPQPRGYLWQSQLNPTIQRGRVNLPARLYTTYH
jgi:hypothetical protein